MESAANELCAAREDPPCLRATPAREPARSGSEMPIEQYKTRSGQRPFVLELQSCGSGQGGAGYTRDSLPGSGIRLPSERKKLSSKRSTLHAAEIGRGGCPTQRVPRYLVRKFQSSENVSKLQFPQGIAD